MAQHTRSGFGGFGSNQFGETTLTKVFVGGLAWETQTDTMRRHFEQFGEIVEAVVITDKNTGRSKGYGFVTFRDPEAARRACADPTPIIDGRRANCNLASLGARPRMPLPPYGLRFRPMHLPSAGSPTGAPGYAAGLPPAFPRTSPFLYQQGISYNPSYGYPQYSPDYSFQQNVFSPYGSPQHYAAMYGGPGGTVSNSGVYTYSAYGQPLHAGAASYPSFPGYGLQGPQLMQYGIPAVSGINNMSPLSAAVVPLQSGVPSSALTSVRSFRAVSSTPAASGASTLQQFVFPASPQHRSSLGGNMDQQTST